MLAGVGTIERPAASSGSSKFQKGQRVVGFPFESRPGQGTWQQYVAVPESQLLAVPDSLSDEAASQFYVSPTS